MEYKQNKGLHLAGLARVVSLEQDLGGKGGREEVSPDRRRWLTSHEGLLSPE